MEFSGMVVGGSNKANALGYPTANIALAENISGIYAAEVRVDRSLYPAVAFADPARKILEAHLFHFSGSLYGQQIKIMLLHKLRETKAFTNDAELKEAMAEDAAAAKAYFASK